MKLLEGLEFIITHIEREENKEADKLANEAMNEEVVGKEWEDIIDEWGILAE